MGDTSNNQDEVIVQQTDPNPSAGTVNTLPVVKPSASLTVLNKTPGPSQEKIEKIHEEALSAETLPKVESSIENNTEVAQKPPEQKASEQKAPEQKASQKGDGKGFEDERKPLIDSLICEPKDAHEQVKDHIASNSSPVTPVEKKTRVGSAASGLMQGERINRNQSDIFSLKEETSIASSIFSVNGSPSRKVFRRRELAANNVFPFGQKEEPPSDKPSSSPRETIIKETKESYNELRRPSSSVRNPLTGTGLNSNDEYKFKGTKRKDGNPLLGLGYSPEATPSTHRIPPGGYSHKLW